MKLPKLECLQLWLGGNYWSNDLANAIEPILSNRAYPKLKYLGLCDCDGTLLLLKILVESPIVKQLAVLDLQMGTLKESDLSSIFEDLRCLNLELLNLSANCLFDSGVAKLAQLPYRVEIKNQYTRGDRHWTLYE